jgi:hypothetical protein
MMQRSRPFLELRWLRSWNDDTANWDERGFEQVAEAIAWELLDEEHGLYSIPESSPEDMTAAYEQLTGNLGRSRVDGSLQPRLLQDLQQRARSSSKALRTSLVVSSRIVLSDLPLEGVGRWTDFEGQRFRWWSLS